LHWNENYQQTGILIALHYTKEKDFMKTIKKMLIFAYWLQPVGGVTTTDLVRQKWLDNDFYGTTFSANYKDAKLDFILVEE
jgi:iron complex outermembrane receptor protein